MVRNTYGSHNGQTFVAKVVDRFDKEQRGRLKIEIQGGYQGQDGESLWGNPVYPVTGGMMGGIGGFATGALEDTMVVGYFAADGLPMITGTIAASNKEDESNDPIGKDRNHDIHRISRDKTKKGGDYRFDPDQKKYGDESITVYARDKFPNPHGRRHTREYDDETTFTIGVTKFGDA
jgi:hypothetical protein